MKIRVLGGGFYGAHLAVSLMDAGHEIELHEIAEHLFAGASGAMPARLHAGFHYPRSRLTRAVCQENHAEFMARYGHLTRAVPVNLYAVADDSLVDFGTYKKVLSGEVEYITVERPAEFGLRGVEGAILTGERHIVIRESREYFRKRLDGRVAFGVVPTEIDDPRWDVTLDCTFAANGSAGIDRYEPCLTVLLEGPADKAVTIMDGQFPSVYPYDDGLSSLTSARYTPLTRCSSYMQARETLNEFRSHRMVATAMIEQMAKYWPGVRGYRVADYLTGIRAMPKSAADARLVSVDRTSRRGIRVRAGKVDAILHAERLVKEMLHG